MDQDQALAILQLKRFAGEAVIDVGSGGGIPGLPLAICCGDAHFTLCDSNQKKITVLSDIVARVSARSHIACTAQYTSMYPYYAWVSWLGVCAHVLTGRSIWVSHVL
jgi:16S rRNA (guanine527-N7)-methyltransferase